jgi:hypothetical protein
LKNEQQGDVEMDWDAIGALAELLAAVGGIVAIFYLAIQIRINTKAIQSSSIDSWVSAISIANEANAHTDEFISIAMDSYDDLDPRQRILFHRAMAQNMNAMEAMYLHHLNGVVDSTFFESKMNSMKPYYELEGWRRWWSRKGASFLDPRFVAYVENHFTTVGRHP